MNLLVLGGTRFLGRHIVEAARAAGHDVTIFHRGHHVLAAPDAVTVLHGDRNGNCRALAGRAFDAVIDTSAYEPAHIDRVYEALASVGHYTLVSTISVYAACPPGAHTDEEARVHDGHDGYGARKARAEEAAERAWPGSVAHVRPGLIAGPWDPTARFTYWPRRAARGGDILAPGRPERPVQFIDVRDLAAWCVRLAASKTTGVFNAVGPSGTLTMGALLEACVHEAGVPSCLRWWSDAALLAAGVAPWTELPLWIPEDDAEAGGLMSLSNARAVAAGLTFRPVADTVRDTYAWDVGVGASGGPDAVRALSPDREAALLQT